MNSFGSCQEFFLSCGDIWHLVIPILILDGNQRVEDLDMLGCVWPQTSTRLAKKSRSADTKLIYMMLSRQNLFGSLLSFVNTLVAVVIEFITRYG